MQFESTIYDPLVEIAKGKANAIRVMDEGCDIGAAFKHPTLGHISLLYGDRSWGVRHILMRREREIADDARLASQLPREVVLKLIEVIVLGAPTTKAGKRLLEYDGHLAILAQPQGDQINWWLLSGYRLMRK